MSDGRSSQLVVGLCRRAGGLRHWAVIAARLASLPAGRDLRRESAGPDQPGCRARTTNCAAGIGAQRPSGTSKPRRNDDRSPGGCDGTDTAEASGCGAGRGGRRRCGPGVEPGRERRPTRRADARCGHRPPRRRPGCLPAGVGVRPAVAGTRLPWSSGPVRQHPISIEPGDRVGATQLQLTTQHVPIAHPSSIGARRRPTSTPWAAPRTVCSGGSGVASAAHGGMSVPLWAVRREALREGGSGVRSVPALTLPGAALSCRRGTGGACAGVREPAAGPGWAVG